MRRFLCNFQSLSNSLRHGYARILTSFWYVNYLPSNCCLDRRDTRRRRGRIFKDQSPLTWLDSLDFSSLFSRDTLLSTEIFQLKHEVAAICIAKWSIVTVFHVIQSNLTTDESDVARSRAANWKTEKCPSLFPFIFHRLKSRPSRPLVFVILTLSKVRGASISIRCVIARCF